MHRKSSLNPVELRDYLSKQLYHFFPDANKASFWRTSVAVRIKMNLIEEALDRTFNCFSVINSPIYYSNGLTYFNHLNGDQYASYLYFLSRVAYENGNEELYYKSALLNKALNGIDLFGHVKMPNYFLLVHPVGTVIGRAEFGDFLTVYQGVTIGGKHTVQGKIEYPSIGDNVTIFSNASVLGSSKIGDNCVIGANASIMSKDYSMPNKLITGGFKENRVQDLKSKNNFFKG